MTTLVQDGLANVVANIATEKDKASAWSFYANLVDTNTAETIYRGTWLARKVARIIPGDATREWRLWKTDAATIEKIETVERQFRVHHLVREAWTWARVFGGAALLFGFKGEDDLEKPTQGGKEITYVRVLTAQVLEGDTTTITIDLTSPNYGLPEIYVYRPKNIRVEQRIHYSRLVRFYGDRLPPDSVLESTLKGWGESIYVGIMSAMTQAGGSSAVLASLLPEAKTDVISVEGLGGLISRPEGEALIQKRFALAAMLKSINNTLLLDKNDGYEQKQINFASITDVHRTLFAEFCAAADVPQTRMLGQSPGGLQSTGEADQRNYYDAIRDQQENELRPALDQIDAFMFAHAKISVGDKDWYEFAPLWSPKASESAEVEAKFATAIKALADSGLFADEFLSDIARRRMTESGQWPGIEDAADEVPVDDPAEDQQDVTGNDPASLADAAPKTLYVSRRVANADEVIKWAKQQGFKTTLAADDLHVTIAFSRAPVDWFAVGQSADKVMISAGGPRQIEQFGGGAVVLRFASWELAWRHDEIERLGASWDWPEYAPHITLTYDPGDIDITKIEPYQGKIVLGAEHFAEVNEEWKANVREA